MTQVKTEPELYTKWAQEAKKNPLYDGRPTQQQIEGWAAVMSSPELPDAAKKWIEKNKDRLYSAMPAPQTVVWAGLRLLVSTSKESAFDRENIAAKTIKVTEAREPKTKEVELLAHQLHQHLIKLFGALGMRRPPIEIEEPWREYNGMLWVSSVGADYLEKHLGKPGRDLAEKIRKSERTKWSEWTGKQQTLPIPEIMPQDIWSVWQLWFDADAGSEDQTTKFASYLCWAVWEHETKGRLILSEATPRALPMPLYESTIRPMTTKAKVVGGDIVDGRGNVIEALSHPPSMDLDMLDALTPKGVQLLRSANGYRTIFWIGDTVHKQWLYQNRRPDVIEVKGGFRSLANEVIKAVGDREGVASRKDADQIKAILVALSRRMVGSWETSGASALIMLSWEKAYGRRSGSVQIKTHDAWVPYYLNRNQEKRTIAQRFGRQLAPLVTVPTTASKIAGPQWGYGYSLIGDMVRSSDTVAKIGGFAESGESREERGVAVGLAGKSLANTWGHWKETGFIEEPEPGLVKLGRAQKEAWDFIVSGGERRVAAAKGGKKK